MAGFDGAGSFVRTYNWTSDAANAIPILASRFDTEDNGFAAGLSNCICRDGQSTISANIPFNSKRITGLGDASASTDAVNLQTGDSRYGETLGSFTGTYTGMTSSTTVTCQYVLTPNTVVLYIPSNTGTSNTTTLTLTGLPAAIRGTLGVAQTFCVPEIANNGTLLQGRGYVTLNAAQTLLTFVVDGNATGFTSSGTKGVTASFTIVYKLK